jgi:hypothetical protein
MNVSKDFTLAEFVPPDILEMSPVNGIWFLDPRIIAIAQFIRDRYGKPVTINNYLSGGSYSLSGFRDPLSTVGALFSQHKFGRAIDVKVQGMTPQEVRADIQENWPAFKAIGLTTIEENTPTWTHLDCRHTGMQELFIVKPK